MAMMALPPASHLRRGMIGNLLRQRNNRRLIEDLHRGLVAAARHPGLFRPPYEIPDTLDGRFDVVVLLSFLLVRRLESLANPAPEIAQELVNKLFEHFDSGLREMGVGDLSVPKRMKKLAEAFGGRNVAYRTAFAGDESGLAAALARNVYGLEHPDGRAQALAAYCRHVIAKLEPAELTELLADPPFPDPESSHVRAR